MVRKHTLIDKRPIELPYWLARTTVAAGVYPGDYFIRNPIFTSDALKFLHWRDLVVGPEAHTLKELHVTPQDMEEGSLFFLKHYRKLGLIYSI